MGGCWEKNFFSAENILSCHLLQLCCNSGKYNCYHNTCIICTNYTNLKFIIVPKNKFKIDVMPA